MNVFTEFSKLVADLGRREIRYALVGGVAMAFYAEPRFTRDIDILIHPEDHQALGEILVGQGYFESAKPWKFSKVDIRLDRFLKISGEDEMMIDVLIADSEEVRRVIDDAREAESEHGTVRVAAKRDLIWLKSFRDSKQDQADIEKLKHEED